MYISPLYVGSITDVQLTQASGFLETVSDKPGISIMADRGFTIKEMLQAIGVQLNTPPFLEGRRQLPAEEISTGRKIASLRIHVERAIGRIKNYSILKATIPLTLSSLSNQIVCVCSFLTNFLPALVPCPDKLEDCNIESYFHSLTDSDTDSMCSNDSECSSNEDN